MMNDLIEPDFSSDILQLLPDNLIPNYQMICEKYLPDTLRSHHFLLLHGRWKDFLNRAENRELKQTILSTYNVNIYVPRHANIENCTFVAIVNEFCESNQRNYSIFAFTLEKPACELDNSFRNTNRINWNRGPLIESLHIEYVDAFKSILTEKGLHLDTNCTNLDYCVWLPKGNAKSFNVHLPDDYMLAPLSKLHAELINDSWLFQNEQSSEYIRLLIILNGGLGLFKKCNEELLSWIVTNENLAPGCLQTKECARRKGLAKLLLREYCKQFAVKENLDILAFISEENVISFKIFMDVGFQVLHGCSWLKIKPNQIENPNKF